MAFQRYLLGRILHRDRSGKLPASRRMALQRLRGERCGCLHHGKALPCRDGAKTPWFRSMYNHLEYYRYLNGGYRLPLVGGTDKMSSDVPVGLYRTYVSIPSDQDFTYETWCANLAAGRTFMSGGPIISFSVDGHTIGDTVRLSGNGGTV